MSAAWFACEEPERPTDPYVVWHYGFNLGSWCLACHVKADALARQHPDDGSVAWLVEAVGGPS